MGWTGAEIHSNEAGEISAITEKASPVDADLVIIEDSADSNAKKKVQVGNLPGGGGGGGGRTLLDSETLASDSTTIEISGISGAHEDLLLKVWARTDTAFAGDSFTMRVGNTTVDTGSNYSWVLRSYGDVNAGDQDGDVTELWDATNGAVFTGDGATTGHYGFALIEIDAYADTTFHRFIRHRGFRRSTSTNHRFAVGEGVWQNTADAIDIIELSPINGTNFNSGSYWELWGID